MADTSERSASRPMQWLRIYFALAAPDLLTVGASLYMNHQLMGIYSASVETNRLWTERLVRYEQLRTLAGAVNAPGNDVFDTRDVEIALAALTGQVYAIQTAALARQQELASRLRTLEYLIAGGLVIMIL